jgi:hypothetical protein
MIIFKHLRKRRLAVKLTELTHGESIAICKLESGKNEFSTTELLRCIAKGADQPRPNFVTNPLLWTVQERTMLVCYYLAQVSSDGPDFAVANARLSDYVDFDRDSTTDETDLGTVIKNPMVMRPLLGAHAQALEGICHDRDDWVTGAMACQIFQRGEVSPDWAALSDLEIQQWIQAKAALLAGLPESDFDKLYAAWLLGMESLAHFVHYAFDDDGIMFTAIEKEGGGADHPPARFLPDSAVSAITRSLS